MEGLELIEIMILSIGLLPLLFILIWEITEGLSFLSSKTARRIAAITVTVYSWSALVRVFLEPIIYMFGFTAFMLISTLLIVIMLASIIMLRRRVRRIM